MMPEPPSFLRQTISINMAYSHFILMPVAHGPLLRKEGLAFRIACSGKPTPMDAARIQALIETGLPGARVRREFQPAGIACAIEIDLPESGNGPEN